MLHSAGPVGPRSFRAKKSVTFAFFPRVSADGALSPMKPATTAIYQGRERVLAELCREHGVDRQTVQYRLDKGLSVAEALTKPLRRYPRRRKKKAPQVVTQTVYAPGPTAAEINLLIADAVDIVLDARAVIQAFDPSPRRARIITLASLWLRRAGSRG